MSQENYLGDLHMRYDWVIQLTINTTLHEWTLSDDTLQSDTFSRMLSHCWIHIGAAIMPPAQSALIDYTVGVLC